MKKAKNVSHYIAAAPPHVRPKLKQLRAIIKSAAPHAEERISYGMPQYKLHDQVLVYFAAFKNHVSIFPGPDTIAALRKGLSAYHISKGTIQFPLGKQIPVSLVKRILDYRVKLLASKIKQ